MGVISAIVEKNWGKRTLAFDSLKFINLGLAAGQLPSSRAGAAGLPPSPPHRSCRNVAELPPLDLPAAAVVQLPEYTAGAAGLLPKLWRRPDGFDGGRTAAEASTAVRRGVARRQSGISGSTLPFSSMSPP